MKLPALLRNALGDNLGALPGLGGVLAGVL